MTDPRIERLTEMVAALRQEGYNRQESIELLYARVEALEAAQQPEQDSPPPQKQTELELEEILAQIIYEQAIIPTARHCHAEAPEWVVSGNSIAQDDARATARAIIRRWPRGDQPQPQQDHVADASKMVDTGWRRLHDLSPIMEPAPPEPAPAGGLVDMICRQLPLSPGEARAVVRVVAAWLRSGLISRAIANRLDQEAER